MGGDVRPGRGVLHPAQADNPRVVVDVRGGDTESLLPARVPRGQNCLQRDVQVFGHPGRA